MKHAAPRLGLLFIVVLLIIGIAHTAMLRAGDSSKTIRIIYTNDTLGYLESCGCGGSNDGGLARRATLISKLTKEQPNSVILESGNLAHTPEKLPVLFKSFLYMNYCAVGVGEADAQIAPQFFKLATDNKITIIDMLSEPGEYVAPYVVKNVDGVRVGIVSFGYPPVSGSLSESDVRKLRYSAFKSARDASDVLIVLDQANLITAEWLQRNEKRLGVPDVVISGIMNQGLLQEKVIGSTRILPTSRQGRHLGVADVEIVDGAIKKVTCQKIGIEPPIDEEPEIAKMVKETMQGSGGMGQEFTFTGPAIDPSQPYYSVDYCKSCHLKEYQDWINSDHARAIDTLMNAKRMVPECLECHSEQYRRQAKVRVPIAGIGGGIECATCHAASLPHGMERRNVANKTKVDPQMCLGCHTKDRSPHYDEKTYFPMVSHVKH